MLAILMMVLVSAAAASAALSVSPFSWVVIVAGSNGYQVQMKWVHP